MPAERYFIDKLLQEGGKLLIEDEEFHHFRVMRAQEGDSLELVNGQGALAVASVIQIEKKRAYLQIERVKSFDIPDNRLVLALAIPRINRLDFIVEKGTELGLTDLWLFPGQRSERKELTEHQLERLRSIAIAAMKQCGRLFLPKICLKPPLTKWEPLPFTAFFGDVDPAAPALNTQKIPNKTIVFIGPESGFENTEIETLRKMGVQGVKLHSNILRVDTAALVALTLLS